MARKRKRPSGDCDPKELGARWRALMTDETEGLPALVWRRVLRLFRIDLSDPRQADDVQVFEVLRDLMDTRDPRGIDVAVIELEALVDNRVPEVFGR